MERALRKMDFTVVKVHNGNREAMWAALLNLKAQLKASRNSFGLFYFSGHGVQHPDKAESFLVPVDAAISNGDDLTKEGFSLQIILDYMTEAGNDFNIIILDACRNSPLPGSKSISKGLSGISSPPSGSIIMYATKANQVAYDQYNKDHKNSIFTHFLLKHLPTPGLDVKEMADRIRRDVVHATNDKQRPAVYEDLIDKIFLNEKVGQTESISIQKASSVNGNLTGEPAPPHSGSIIKFGPYEWRVLDVQGSNALLLTKDIISMMPYNKEYVACSWKTSTLRKWLNGSFLSSEFSEQEQARIVLMTNINEKNQWHGTEGGSSTKDKIFLLSLSEVVKYFGDSEQLDNGSGSTNYINDEYNSARRANYNGSPSWWWLRSPGSDRNNAACVNTSGPLNVNGSSVNIDFGGIRPALWLDWRVQHP
jgi:hypothetical protein